MASKHSNASAAETLARGMAHHKAGDHAAAERCYRAIKRRDPEYVEALRLRGVLAYQGGDIAAAIRALETAIKHGPRQAHLHHALGEFERARGRLAAAITHYRRAWRLDSGRVENALDLARALFDHGLADEAERIYHEVIARFPHDTVAPARLAWSQYVRGAPAAARATLAAWQQRLGSEPRQWHALARAWRDIEASDDAEHIYRRLAEADRQDAAAQAGLGALAHAGGEFAAAEQYFDRALRIAPGQTWVYPLLTANKTISAERARIDQAQTLLDEPRLAPAARVPLYFALGQWFDRERDPSRAFEYFSAGNTLQARLTPFEPRVFDTRIARLQRYFTPETAAAAPGASDSQKPIFVVGMPRSGTSLVEQILASHSAAHGAGEVEDMRHMVREVGHLAGADRNFPDGLERLSAEQNAGLAARYLQGLDQRAPAAARVVDKMPFNLLWLGWIARLFPNARVIYCRREAMDNALSCYFQLFSQGLRFSYDLAHLGRVYRQVEALMAHWADVLSLPMLTVDYENLVSEGEPAIRQLIDFAGLDWEAGCLDFHRTGRDVRTASVWQVRQPLYQSSVARWRAYEAWLGPLAEALKQPG